VFPGRPRLRGTLSFRNDNVHYVILGGGMEMRVHRIDENIGRIYFVSNDQPVRELAS
jgi:hypothetical protein